MNIATYAIEKPLNTWLLMLFCLVGGIWALITIGKLEDPAFTIKQAVVITSYPGATATEVEHEVTELLESAIQQLPQLKQLTSKSLPGYSEIKVEIKDQYRGEQIAQIWDELRRKVNDISGQLPEGAALPVVNDDFGDVFGIFYAVTAPDFSDKETRELATFLRRELLTIPGVAKVQTAGEPQERVYIEINNQKLTSLGISLDEIISALQAENAVATAADLDIGDKKVRLITRPGLASVDAIGNLRIGKTGSTEQLTIYDVATVNRQTISTPSHLVRFNGVPAFTLAVAGLSDVNIVDVGNAVDAHLAILAQRIPLGVEFHPVYQQHVIVDAAINSFILNLVISICIVVAVMCLAAGWRAGAVQGLTLLLTVLGAVFFMRLFDIEMERVSLGAMIIAMGMLIDNSLVVAENMLISMQRGTNSVKAAAEACNRTKMPLLSATLIGIMAFSAIGLSPDTTGEFLGSLFAVLAISLLLSWVLAFTVTPLLAHYLFKTGSADQADEVYSGKSYQYYRRFLTFCLQHRSKTLLLLVALTLSCLAGFGQVKQSFFPPSNTPLFYVNYLLPQGSSIHATARDITEIEHYIKELPGVESVTTFIGRGASRFMLTYSSEPANPAFGHLIIRTSNRHQIPALMQQLRETLPVKYLDAEIYTQQLMFGPGDGAKVEARFSGADETVLRQLAAQVTGILLNTEGITDVRTDWRQRELIIVPEFNEERARVAGINRTDLAKTLAFTTTGRTGGALREGDEHIPIIVRPPAAERQSVARLDERLIWSNSGQDYIPITQVVDRFTLTHEEAIIHRRDRLRTITVMAEPVGSITASEALARVKQQIEAIKLPAGYQFEWGGEYENSQRSQGSLGSKLPMSLIGMLLISILLFGSLKQPLIIWLIVPMSICGVTIGLLATNMAFSFTALLGFLGLSGMLIKNAIVLIDEIDNEIRTQGNQASAIITASVSRLRPVILNALTTVLGMVPLLWDAFFDSMAVTIMAGLTFATILTLIAAPVLYALVFRITLKQPETAKG